MRSLLLSTSVVRSLLLTTSVVRSLLLATSPLTTEVAQQRYREVSNATGS